MLNRIYNVSKMEHPLSAFDKLDQFKLFLFDTGLLKHMAGIDNSAILLKADYQFKGPLTENYVLQQLRGQFEVEPRYYSDKTGEIDFLLQNGTEIIPVEATGRRGQVCAILQAIYCEPSAGTRHPVVQSADTERMVRLRTSRFISPEKQKSCCDANLLSHCEGICLSALMDRPHGPQHPQPRGRTIHLRITQNRKISANSSDLPAAQGDCPAKTPPKSALPARGFLGRFFRISTGFLRGVS